MVREPSRNTAFTSPQGWVGEIVSQVRTGGFLTFEYHMWRDQKSKDNGEPPFLLNNHKAQIRETHQRIRTTVDGHLLHRGDGVTPVPVEPTLAYAFLTTNPIASIYVQSTNLIEWIDTRGRKLAPFVFPKYSGVDEPLDSQWLRETFQVSLVSQVDEVIQRYLTVAHANDITGDRRGTTINLQISESADDAVENSLGNTIIDFASTFTQDAENELSGYRWQNVTIAGGSTINSAVYSVVPIDNSNDEPLHPIYLNDADNAAQWTAGTGNTDISGRTKTTATVTWDNTNLGADGATFFSAPDISTLVDEVITRGGWSSGNALALIIYGTAASPLRDLAITQYDANTSLAAKLDIDYTAGGGGDPEALLVGGKLIRGGLLLRGALVR